MKTLHSFLPAMPIALRFGPLLFSHPKPGLPDKPPLASP